MADLSGPKRVPDERVPQGIGPVSWPADFGRWEVESSGFPCSAFSDGLGRRFEEIVHAPPYILGCLSLEKPLMHLMRNLVIRVSEVLTSARDKKIVREWEVVNYGAPHGSKRGVENEETRPPGRLAPHAPVTTRAEAVGIRRGISAARSIAQPTRNDPRNHRLSCINHGGFVE